MASRFYGGDSASESEDQSGQEETTNIQTEPKFAGYDSSSDDEDNREVRSEKDKRYDELKSAISQIRKDQKIDDWTLVLQDYETLLKKITKAKKVIRKEGTPEFVVRAFVQLLANAEDTKEKAKSEGKKISKKSSQSLNRLIQKLKRTCKSYDKDIEKLKKTGKLNVVDKFKGEDSSDEDSGDESEAKQSSMADDGSADGHADNVDVDDGKNNGNYSDGSDWSDDGAGSGSDSGSDIDVDAGPQGITRDFWVKKTKAGATTEKRIRKNVATGPKKKEERKVEAKKEMNAEAVIRKLKDIEDKRGRRGIDKKAYIEDLKLLLTKAKHQATRLKIQTLLATALFDISLNTGKAMPVELWKTCAGQVDQIIDTLVANELLRLSEDEDFEENYEEKELDDGKTEKKEGEEHEVIYVKGNLFSFVSRLSAQFTQSLQEIDQHDAKYVSRIKDETTMVRIIKKCGEYYVHIKKEDYLVKIDLLHLTHVYYTYNKDLDQFNAVKSASKGYMMKNKPLFTKGPGVVEQLVRRLYNAEGARSKTTALLCHVYHFCVHNRFHEARNLLLMSHLQDVIQNADIDSRILYNRTLAQLGLCAFRNGHYGASLDCLSELYLYSNRIKELLAQGVTKTSRYHERNLEKEKLERMREYPYHMHMNLDMLEAVNLISAMFAEIPNLAKHGDTKRKIISKSFRKQFEHHKKQVFTGPPESTRHLIMCASDALADGDWETCYKHVSALRMWALIPHSKEVEATLKTQIQVSSLQVYLLVYGAQYSSIDVAQLCAMFELKESIIHKVASRMMIRGELLGAWDQPSGCIIMHNEELSRLQATALAYADKVTQYVDVNERLLDIRGSYYKSQDYQRNNQDKKGQQGTRNNYNNKNRGYSRRGQMSRTSRY